MSDKTFLGMPSMQVGELIDHLKANKKKYAVCVIDLDGTLRAMVVTEDEKIFAMDLPMLEDVLPMLEKARDTLREQARKDRKH